jgi:phosphate starvation-inducible protein PhoH
VANGDTIVEHRLDTEGADQLMLAGVNDRNIQELSRLFGIRAVLRGNQLILSGSLEAVEAAVPVVQHVIELSRLRVPFDTPDLARFADGATALGSEGRFDSRSRDLGGSSFPSPMGSGVT